jgi:DNA-binding response OmpR family regulator
MSKVLLIDDDIEIFKLINNFVDGSFEFEHVTNLADAKKTVQHKAPDVILLDLSLDDGDGLEFYQSNKKALEDAKVSIIMISKNEELNKKLESFEMGAVDYICKPFEPREVLARIKNHLKRAQTNHLVSRKDITLNHLVNKAFINGAELDLSPLEFKMLTFFVHHEDEVFSRDQLIQHIWGGNVSVTDRTVDQHISKLRKKLSSDFYSIKTTHGMGYSFVAN